MPSPVGAAGTSLAAAPEETLKVGRPEAEDLELIGVVTEREVCCGVAADARRASDVRAEEIMRPSSACCGADEPVEEARRKLHEHRAASFPVVDKAGGCCGTVSIHRLERS